MNLRKWTKDHARKLLAIHDTPTAIAGGVAIGIFFGFTPLTGLKTLSAMFFAWITRTNIVAAVAATALHDLLLPLMPVIYVFEYKVGFWLLHQEWPRNMARLHLRWQEWLSWTTFLTIGKPLLLGSIICGLPVSLILYFVVKGIVRRHQLKKELALAGTVTGIPKD